VALPGLRTVEYGSPSLTNCACLKEEQRQKLPIKSPGDGDRPIAGVADILTRSKIPKVALLPDLAAEQQHAATTLNYLFGGLRSRPISRS